MKEPRTVTFPFLKVALAAFAGAALAVTGAIWGWQQWSVRKASRELKALQQEAARVSAERRAPAAVDHEE